MARLPPPHMETRFDFGSQAAELGTVTVLAGAEPTSATDGFGQKTDKHSRKRL